MKIIYLSGGLVSVYDSQVLAYLDYLVEQSHEVYLLQGYASENEKNILKQKQSTHCGINIIWYKSKPVYPFFEFFKEKNIYKAITTILNYHDAIIHVRSEIEGYLLKKIALKNKLNNPILIDIRGVVCEEFKYKIIYASGIRRLLFRLQQKYMQRCTNYLFSPDNLKIGITSVSPLINKYIMEHYKNYNHTLFLHPNITSKQFIYDEKERQYIRRKYGIEEKDVLAICSTAGNAVWQKDSLVINKLIDLGVKVINLSKKDPNIKGCVTISVPFSDMPKMLSAADIAILWRDNTFMNNSASPSKFSEFATMGLYVIHNKSVVVATDYIKSTGAGMLVENVDDIKNIPSSEFFYKNRKEWIIQGNKKFGINELGKSYLETYDKIKSSL